MRIDIRASAADHGITPDEVRAVVTFPALRLTLAPQHLFSRPSFRS